MSFFDDIFYRDKTISDTQQTRERMSSSVTYICPGRGDEVQAVLLHIIRDAEGQVQILLQEWVHGWGWANEGYFPP